MPVSHTIFVSLGDLQHFLRENCVFNTLLKVIGIKMGLSVYCTLQNKVMSSNVQYTLYTIHRYYMIRIYSEEKSN